MSYILKHDMPGLRKGAIIHFDKKNNKYYAPKDSYIEFYWFTKAEVETNKKWFKPRAFFTLLLIIFCLDSFCQSAQWETVNEKSIKGYVVQDSVTKWQSRDTIKKGKTSYSYNFPASGWFRTKAYYDSAGINKGFFTPANYVIVSSNSAKITNAVWHTTSLTWTTANEKNVKYFFIQKTRNGLTTKVTNYTPKGGGNYTYRYSRTVFKYTYKIQAIFKDGPPGPSITFK